MSMLTSTTILRRLAVATGAAVVALLATPASGLAAPASPNLAPVAAVRAGVASVPPAVASAPVGKLSPAGCQSDGAGNDTCHLWAAKTTMSISSSLPIPVWGFSTTEASTASVQPSSPGPQLVVTQGDTVTLTVHNELPAGQQLSLALPGIPANAFSPALDSARERSGAGVGSSLTYTFTASRPGTFLYEAGHTPDGSRQLAMGLVGALVVLPSDGTAYGPASTDYQDESVMVLTEIDPALNADPVGFDMRGYNPTYRLINGKSFPEIPVVPTGVGNIVLLRLVNGGAIQHPMTLLGAVATSIARDAHPLAYPQTDVTTVVEPGATEDVLVTMSGGLDSKVTVYESGIHLDNASAQTDNPLQTAFGGMMTVLDTNAPVPADDAVGPVTSAVAASPNPSTGVLPVTVTADLSDVKNGGSAIASAEFVLDEPTDVGVGFGTGMDITGTGTATASASGVLTTDAMDALAAGKHTIYVRGRDAVGNWGVIGSVIFNLPKTGPPTSAGSANPPISNQSARITITATGDDTDAGGGNITAAEFFVTEDSNPMVVPTPVNGTGAVMTRNRVAPVVAETGYIAPTPLLTEGKHHAWVHSKNSLGTWGPLLDIPFTVDRTGPTVTGANLAPNSTNGVLSSPAYPGNAVVSAMVTDGGAGWSSNIVDAEAFLDSQTADGTGVQLIPTDGLLDSADEAVYGLIPMTQIRTLSEGNHQVFVHGQDAAGNWGVSFAASFTVDKTAPTLGTLSVTPNPTNGASTVTARVGYTDASQAAGGEFWFGATDPGVGRATPVSVAIGTDGIATAIISLAGVPNGAQQLHLRIQDKASNWSATASASLTVGSPALLTETFPTATLNPAWTRTAPAQANRGTISVTSAANLPSASAGQFGLQVTYPVNFQTGQPAYISRALGATLTTARVDLDLKANAFTPGLGATPTIFSATTAGGAQVFSLQIRNTNATTRQVRTVLVTGTNTVVYGGWVTVPGGAGTVSMAWRAGPAGGPAALRGGVTLTINHGAVATTQTGNTNTQRVAAVRMGVITGQTFLTRGTLYLDNLTVAQ